MCCMHDSMQDMVVFGREMVVLQESRENVLKVDKLWQKMQKLEKVWEMLKNVR